MGKQNVAKVNYNVGIIDENAMARFDINRGQLSASIQENWMPRTLGSMSLRAGTAYVGRTYEDEPTYNLPFVFTSNDTAIIELTKNNMRVLVDEVPVSREAVTTVVVNGGFDSNLNGWTDQSEVGANAYQTNSPVELGYSQITNFNERAIAVRANSSQVDWLKIEALLTKYAPGIIPDGFGSRTKYFNSNPTQNAAAFSEARSLALNGFTDPFSHNFNERVLSVAGYVSVAQYDTLKNIITKYAGAATGGGIRTKYFNDNPEDNASAFIEAQNASIAGFVLGSSEGAGYLGLRGTGYNFAAVTQRVEVAESERYKKHGLRIKVDRGKVRLRIGSFVEGDPYFPEITLRPGIYSFSIIPRDDFSITFINYELTETLIEAVQIEGAGDMVLPTQWSDIYSVREEQSADVVFMACYGVAPKRLERYGVESWGIAEYDIEDGPFRPINTSKTKLSIDVLTGNGYITASRPIFNAGHIGGLFSITSSSQGVSAALSGGDQYSDSVRIVGLTATREFTYTISGTWSATHITLQRSIGDEVSWEDTGTVHLVNGTYKLNDTKDNQEVYYRLGISAGQYTSGTVNITITSPYGGITGIARVTSLQNSKLIGVEIIKPFGSTEATTLWSEGRWSAYRGFPSSIGFMDGRLWWSGKDDIVGSVSDNYHSFDGTVEGDSAPILRSLGYGAVDRVNWIVALQRLIIGTESDERTARSSSLDEPLTPANFSMKSASTQGSANIDAVVLNDTCLFVDASYRRVFELAQNQNYDYSASELSLLVPSLFAAGVRRVAVQKKPDTRIHCVMRDGKVNILTYDKAEDVKCWTTFATKGQVEDVVILPSTYGDDKVYYTVHRALDYDGFPFDFHFQYNGTGRNERERMFRKIGYTDAFGDGMADAWALKVYGTTDIDAIINSGDAAGVGLEIDKSQLFWGGGRNLEEVAIRLNGYTGAFGQNNELDWLATRYGTEDINELYTETITSDLYYGTGRNIYEVGVRYLGYTGAFGAGGDTEYLMKNYATSDANEAIYRYAMLTNPLGNKSASTGDVSLYHSARYLERLVSDEECIGETITRLSDSHVEFSSNIATTNITGLSHLNGHHVVVWGNRKYLGYYQVSSGSITINESTRYAIVGIPYAAFYKSAKLAYAAGLGTGLGQKKKVGGVSFILKNTHARGLKYGDAANNLQSMPFVEDGVIVDSNKIWQSYDKERIPMPSNFNTDSRLCLAAYAPRPCTVLGAIITVETNDKI
jgi:hypothetical protein